MGDSATGSTSSCCSAASRPSTTSAARPRRTCCAAVDPARYRITPIGIGRDGAVGARRGRPERAGRRARPRCPTASTRRAGGRRRRGARRRRRRRTVTVVLPLLHGPMGEDGTVQGMLELADVAYVGAGVLGSALAMDKAMAKQVLAANGIAQARYRCVRATRSTPAVAAATLADELGLPLFVKPANMGSSVGVSKAHDRRRAVATRSTYALTLRRVGRRRGGGRRPRDRGGRARQRSTRARQRAGRDRPGRRVLRLRGQVRRPTAPQLLIPAPLDRRADRRGAGPRRARCSGRCAATAWPASTSSSRRAAAASCATRSTRCRASRRSRCTRSCGRRPGCRYPELIDELVALALERHARRRRNTKH